MKILFIASEAFPLAKVGGLADVVSSLAIALHEYGHEPCLILPKYRSIKARLQEIPDSDVTVNSMGHDEKLALRMTSLKEVVPVYLVENDTYFGTDEIYAQGELERFLFFSQSIPAVISRLNINPDVVHCHDWHTALVTLWLRQANMPSHCVFTLHNLAYQGSFDQQFLLRSGLSSLWHVYVPPAAPKPPLSFMSQGILLADMLTTVSSTYAAEILTPEYGSGLDNLLSYRNSELYGIVNGIDCDEYNPATDPYLQRNYDFGTVEGKTDNKLALQRKSGLPQDPDIPLFGMVSRLDDQKGIDLLLNGIGPFIEQTRAQLVVLGQGREHYQRALTEVASECPSRISVNIARDERLARLVYGGSDMFLMPSLYEPCGLGQLIAMRYGAIPVVRHTGGLADTVKDVAENNGNGFVFANYTVSDMLEAIKRAEASFFRRTEWRNLVRRNMKLDFSWKAPVSKYEEIYLRALRTSRAQ